jgi:hypothetical protein
MGPISKTFQASVILNSSLLGPITMSVVNTVPDLVRDIYFVKHASLLCGRANYGRKSFVKLLKVVKKVESFGSKEGNPGINKKIINIEEPNKLERFSLANFSRQGPVL